MPTVPKLIRFGVIRGRGRKRIQRKKNRERKPVKPKEEVRAETRAGIEAAKRNIELLYTEGSPRARYLSEYVIKMVEDYVKRYRPKKSEGHQRILEEVVNDVRKDVLAMDALPKLNIELQKMTQGREVFSIGDLVATIVDGIFGGKYE